MRSFRPSPASARPDIILGRPSLFSLAAGYGGIRPGFAAPVGLSSQFSYLTPPPLPEVGGPAGVA